MKADRKDVGSSYDDVYDEDLQRITVWTFLGIMVIWIFTIVVKVY
jgi:hypothetical protein